MVVNHKKKERNAAKRIEFHFGKKGFDVLVFTYSNFHFLAHHFPFRRAGLCASPLAVDGRVKESVFVPPSATQTFAWQIESLRV